METNTINELSYHAPLLITILLWVFLSLLVGYFSRNKLLGFRVGFFVSIGLTPIVGYFLMYIAQTKQEFFNDSLCRIKIIKLKALYHDGLISFEELEEGISNVISEHDADFETAYINE